MSSPPEETRTIAEGLLATVCGGPVVLDEGATIEGRDYVFRFAVRDGPASAPGSVIVKRPASWAGRYDPDSGDTHNSAWSLLTDWAGLQFLQEVAEEGLLAPRLYGGDRKAGLIVIEDLGSGERPDHVLLAEDPAAAEATLVELATALGRMHARTAGKQADFGRIQAALGSRLPPQRDFPRRVGPGLRAALDVLGVAAPPGLDADVRAVDETMAQPGPFLAYTHGDPCPDNWLRVGGRLRLLDFEAGAFRHALLDGVYGRIHFPTCWCVNRSPAQVTQRMEAAYREELAQGCPTATDDVAFREAVVVACAYWALSMCDWIVERRAWYAEPRPLKHDQQWGIATLRQRALVRADILAQTTEEYRHLEAVGRAMAAIAAKLRAVWPPEADEMSVYPAFKAYGQQVVAKE